MKDLKSSQPSQPETSPLKQASTTSHRPQPAAPNAKPATSPNATAQSYPQSVSPNVTTATSKPKWSANHPLSACLTPPSNLTSNSANPASQPTQTAPRPPRK